MTRTPLVSFALVLLGSLASVTHAQRVRPESLPQGFVIVVEDQTQAATASKPIYMASGANSWDPGDPKYKLSPRSDKRWQIVIPPDTLGENVEFKFTLGGWNTVELDAEGQEIANRKLPDVDASKLASGEKPVIEFTIPRFRSGEERYVIAREYRPLEVTGTVKRLQVAGGAANASSAMRDLLVWLPPGYGEDATARYPVLYMMDGQDLFTKHALIPDEWHADETAQKLITSGAARPFVIVGVPSGGNDTRIGEYLPASESTTEIGGQTLSAEANLAWLTTEVMPRVERAFSVTEQPSLTAIGGAKEAGTFALYAGLTAPERFGLVLAESPVLAINEKGEEQGGEAWSMAQLLENASTFPAQICLGSSEPARNNPMLYDGGMPPEAAAGSVAWRINQLADLLENKTRVTLDTSYTGGNDNAPATDDQTVWGARLPKALAALFPGTPGQSLTTIPQPSTTTKADAHTNMIDPQDWPAGFTLVLDDASGRADSTHPITVGTNLNNWNPEAPDWVMTQRPDGRWALELDHPEQVARMEFKFTLGSWDTVEVNPDGSERSNRTLPQIDASGLKPDQRPVLEFRVNRFREAEQLDTRDFTDPDRPLEVTGTVERLRIEGGAGRAAHAQRDLLVWLPEGYAAPQNLDHAYPLLLMMDGQNVFEHAPGLPGEWHADETATALIATGSIEPIIIVGVPNTGRFRADEYIPQGWGTLQGVEPSGEAFIEWLADEAVPLIRDRYRVGAGKQSVTIAGASLGGVISLRAITQRPDVFGSALVESCSMLSEDGGGILSGLLGVLDGAPLPDRLWIGMGGHEVSESSRDEPRNRAYRDWAGRLGELYRDAGMPSERVRVEVVPRHTHNEIAWSQRLPDALNFLYGKN